MIDFTPVRQNRIPFVDFFAGFSPQSLRQAADEIYLLILDLLSDCDDHTVLFEPQDPDAYNPYAENPDEIKKPWTLPQVMIHFLSFNDDCASVSAEMARGVKYHGSSRYEFPWKEVNTIAHLRRLVEESRQCCLAGLEMWPDPPHYENTHCIWSSIGEIDARGVYLLGLKHTDDHLAQVREIIRQSNAAQGL